MQYALRLADVDTIKAVAGLWPLALTLVMFAALVLIATVFRAQTRTFIDRLIKFRFNWGKATIAINQDTEALTEIGAASGKQDPLAETKGTGSPTEPQGTSDQPAQSQDWQAEMFMGFWEEEPEKAKLAYEKLQGSETDPEKRIENEAQYLFWSFRSGEASAQTKLRNLERSAREFPMALTTIRRLDALCYKFAGDKAAAATRFCEAADAAINPINRAENIRSAAVIMLEADHRTEAFELIVETLPNTEDSNAKAELYLGLADLYEKESTELRAIMLEKALMYTPLNKDTQFAAAYAYSNSDMNSLAVLHYEKTLAISSKQEMATNNLGVAFKALKLPILAFQRYERSVELGGTLAAANLADILGDVGAVAEAEGILNEAMLKEDCHQNVFFTTNKLKRAAAAEHERKKKIITAAEKQQSLVVRYGDAVLSRGEWIIGDDEWLSTGGKTASVKALDASKVEASWIIEEGAGVFRSAVTYRFVGTRSGLAAAGTVEKFKPDIFHFGKPDAGTYEKVGNGRGYFDNGKIVIGYITEDGTEFRSIELIRRSVQ